MFSGRVTGKHQVPHTVENKNSPGIDATRDGTRPSFYFSPVGVREIAHSNRCISAFLAPQR